MLILVLRWGWTSLISSRRGIRVRLIRYSVVELRMGSLMRRRCQGLIRY